MPNPFPYGTYHPTLKMLKLTSHAWCVAPWSELESFFRKNPNVKRFVYKISLTTNYMERLLSILIEFGNINELFIHLFGDHDFNLLKRELAMLTNRIDFKRFELKLNCERQESQTINALASLQNFTGLHLNRE